MDARPRRLSTADDVAALPAAPGLTPLDAATWARHRPALTLAAMRDGACVARCSIWADNALALDGEPIGVVGHYAAIDADAGRAVLAAAEAELAARGRRTIVGPMDGNTWRSYRFVTDRWTAQGDEPPFFLEPNQPPEWPDHWRSAGFTPLATYTSALNADLSVEDPRTADALARFEAEGGRIRPIDLARFDDELRAVHALSVEAFARNFLYTPIDADEFLAMYAPLRQIIRPEMVLLAERGGELMGFIFCVPDLNEPRRGAPPRTAIVKSMAVRPGRRGAGLGSVLMDLAHRAARGLGFSRAIHALMHETNASARISNRYGRTIRTYTLFAKRVDSR